MQNSALLLRPATPVQDDQCRRLIENLCLDEYMSNFEASLDIRRYYEDVLSWLNGSERVQFTPPSSFHARMTAGITEAFNDFYIRHSKRDLFIFRGEYPYHKDVFESLKRPLFYIDKTPLHSNACVILSVPFSANGAEHPRTRELLQTCSDFGIPVLLDFAFLGLGAKINTARYFDFPCVESFAFSFSKMFSLGRVRAGWQWTRSSGGPLDVVNQWKYTNWLGHYIAQKCFQHFAFDDMYVKYAPLQHKICLELGLEPSETFLFGIGDSSYNAYHRQHTVNRVCISKILEIENRALTQRALDSSL